ncbi:MAG: electron transporter [Prochloraceae cyanobacterium]
MFAPIVVVVRNLMGKAQFNKLRGQAIAKHSQVITNVCNLLGIERTTRQNLIRTARDNGKKLGFLA